MLFDIKNDPVEFAAAAAAARTRSFRRRDTFDMGSFDATSSSQSVADNKRIPTAEFVSPLTALHQSIRRRYPVAAAAAATLRGAVDENESSLDNATELIQDNSHNTPLGVPIRRTSCKRFNRRSISGLQGAKPLLQFFNPGELLQQPSHADALLESTPHLRLISAASANLLMDGHLHHPSMKRGRKMLSGNHLSCPRIIPLLETKGDVLAQCPSSLNSSSTRSGLINCPASIEDDEGDDDDYEAAQLRHRINCRAANELASLLWVLAHEMTLEEYGTIESNVFSDLFTLIHSSPSTLVGIGVDPRQSRLAGLAGLEALLGTPSADDERKSIKFANILSISLRDTHYDVLTEVSRALGRMASRSANVDVVESEVTRALEWLSADRSDRRYVLCRFSIYLVLRKSYIYSVSFL